MKKETFAFKTNIPEKILFQSGVVKEGDSQYGHWKMYNIQVNANDFIIFPSKGLQDRLDQIGELQGRLLEIGKYESEDKKTYWQICDETGAEIDFDINVSSQPKNVAEVKNTTYRPTKEAMGTRKEMTNVMDYKSDMIKKAQASKEDSMRLFSSGRDAVLIVTNLYPELTIEGGDKTKEELIKEKIAEWRKYLYEKIYADVPFV